MAPLAKVMPLKVFENGTAYTSDIIEAIEYAASMGTQIVNCSWGSTTDNPALKEAMEDAQQLLFVCAAGNSGANIDESPVYPASFDCENVISVAAVNRNGLLSGFSNYGEASVDIAAPGEDIISTTPSDGYGNMSGTSMAASFVTGEAALLLGMDSNTSAIELKERIINCSDRLSTLTGKIFGSNKINCNNALNNISSDEIIQIQEGIDIQDSLPVNQNSGEFSLYSFPTVEGQFIKVACGDNHAIALKSDGTTTDRTTPVQVSGLIGVIEIACGSIHTIALKNDGTVWAWGDNFYCQLGDGTSKNRSTPVQVSGLIGV